MKGTYKMLLIISVLCLLISFIWMIVLIITLLTAADRDRLLPIGLLLILASIIHNGAVHFLGYWGGRVFKMNEKDCLTKALEVGTQYGGLASGIALEMGKEVTIGLGPDEYGWWMDISDSSLATWWRNKEPETNENISSVKDEIIIK